MGGFRFFLPAGFVFNIGGGPGFGTALGSPAYRLFAGLLYKSDKEPEPEPIKDTDGDGILDPDDACPLVAEDRDQFEDKDGCPDPDNDEDGIQDTFDQCPMDPEDKDGFEDEEGCPDPDNDRDGVLDTDDQCPMDPEDDDGFQDEDGCPDLDDDQDGIPDTVDVCPNEPETFNDVDDEDGCPDEGRGKVQIRKDHIDVPPVFFATNKDRILARSYGVLEEVADTLLRNPWVHKVEIGGHTDSKGSDASNQDLSERRAASVMNFLIERGIEPERLTSVGYGETRPVALNNTRRGRAKNRRVEFIILDPAMKKTDGSTEVPADTYDGY